MGHCVRFNLLNFHYVYCYFWTRGFSMIAEIRIDFKKLDSKTWSDEILSTSVLPIDYTEYEEGIFDAENICKHRTEFKQLIKDAKESISKAENIIQFIENKCPKRWQLVFFLEENKFHFSNAALNCIEVYL